MSRRNQQFSTADTLNQQAAFAAGVRAAQAQAVGLMPGVPGFLAPQVSGQTTSGRRPSRLQRKGQAAQAVKTVQELYGASDTTAPVDYKEAKIVCFPTALECVLISTAHETGENQYGIVENGKYTVAVVDPTKAKGSNVALVRTTWTAEDGEPEMLYIVHSPAL